MTNQRVFDRRGVIAAAAGWSIVEPARAEQVRAQPTGPSTYSESVMLMLFAPDGSQDLSLRLARLVGQRSSTIWGGYSSAEYAYGLADVAGLTGTPAPTDVAGDAAAFDGGEVWRSAFARTGRLGPAMAGRAWMTGGVHPSADPPLGEGALPARIEMNFKALHAPVAVREGRMEVFGRGDGRIVLPGQDLKFSGYAKWHEQVGDRPRFAPAFTYVALCGANTALLAVTRGDSVNGFALHDGQTTALASLKIAPLAAEREFEVRLIDGRKVQGVARTLRTSSEPIEGQRRPSATVVADTALGPMTGQINDWQPAA